MNYKPYTLEWSRKRYLNEAIQKYFESGVDAEIIVDDIIDCLSETLAHHNTQSEKIQIVMDSINKFRND
jgi:hypothetical protein